MINLFKTNTPLRVASHVAGIIAFTTFMFGCTLSLKTGTAGLDPSEKTINITQFENTTGLGTSDIQVVFTEKAKDYYLQNTKLELVEVDADIDLKCTITSYTLPAVNATSDSQASSAKLQIGVKVEYTRHLFPLDPNNLKGQTFTFFKVFGADEDFNSIEPELIDEISDQLVVNIFNSTIGYW